MKNSNPYCSAKRLPYSDQIFVMNEKGTIDEHGQFDAMASSGGYVSSFNLPHPDWNHIPDDRVYQKSGLSVSSPTDERAIQTDDDLEAEANRATGDFTIYRYYFSSVGWLSILVFAVCISAFVFCISFPSEYIESGHEIRAMLTGLYRYLGQVVGRFECTASL